MELDEIKTFIKDQIVLTESKLSTISDTRTVLIDENNPMVVRERLRVLEQLIDMLQE